MQQPAGADAPLKPNKCGLTGFREWKRGGAGVPENGVDNSNLGRVGVVKLCDDGNVLAVGSNEATAGDETVGGDVEGAERRQALTGGNT